MLLGTDYTADPSVVHAKPNGQCRLKPAEVLAASPYLREHRFVGYPVSPGIMSFESPDGQGGLLLEGCCELMRY